MTGGETRIAYFDCFSGASGDMCLAALVSAGWPAAELQALPLRLRLEGVTISIGETQRGPFHATRVDVRVEARQPHRHLHHVAAIIEAADLQDPVRAGALRVFQRLAEAEAEVHGSTVEKVHFHEVGAVDALVDVVGTIEGLDRLGVSQVYASALGLGRGAVQSEHGLIPIPAPATTLLVRGAPVELPDIRAELLTPTGAALLTTLVQSWGPPPPFRLDRVGTGAGLRDLTERANVLRVLIGEVLAPLPRGRVAVLETALDDENPQLLGALLPRLIEAGALDAMLVPSIMKKGRPGQWLVAICEPPLAETLARLILSETSTLGVRVREEERFELERRTVEVETAFGRVALKVARLPDGGLRAMPEFESVRDLAARAGRPLKEVSEAALAAWHRTQG